MTTGESGRKAEAQNIIEEINRVRDDLGVATSGEQNRTLSWDSPTDRQLVRNAFKGNPKSDEAILPGFGEQGRGRTARDDCGDPHPFICDSCGQSVEFGRTCSQSICVRCGIAWVRDLSIKKSAKVRRIRREKHQHTPDSEHQKEHHEIISPPLTWYYDLARAGYTLKEAQEETKKIVKRILDEQRAQGVLVRHSYRGEHDDGSIKSENDDRGAWKERLNSGREWVDDVRDGLAWKPHYHAIVVSDFVKGGELVEDVEEATGFVIHRIADDDGISLANDGAMARALTYCLSHADIEVNLEGHNRSAVWEVGSFQGDIIRSDGRFSARPSDLEWADNVVREAASTVLGLSSGTTNCGAQLPGVDEPDELARQILEELYPQDEGPDVTTDTVLEHVAAGNIDVDVETTAGGGGNITVRDAFGHSVGSGGWGDWGGADWSAPSTTVDAGEAVRTLVDGDDQEHADDCGCSDDGGHDGADDGAVNGTGDEKCDGTLIPLGEARDRGLIDDPDWCRDAPHVDEAREADLEWPDDLERWQATAPGDTVAGTG
jgi:hypothetical protein